MTPATGARVTPCKHCALAACDLPEGQQYPAFDVVTQLFELAVSGLETELPLDLHDDLARASCSGLRIHRACSRSQFVSLHFVQQALWHNQCAAEHHRGQWRNLCLELELFQALLQPGLEVVRPLTRFTGIEPGAGPAGLLLELELLGTVIPVGDLLREAILDGGLGLGDQRQLRVSNFLQMLRNDMGYGVALRLGFHLAFQPGAFGPIEYGTEARVGICQRTVIQVRRVREVRKEE